MNEMTQKAGLIASPFKDPLRQLYRREIRAPGQWPLPGQRHADHRGRGLRSRPVRQAADIALALDAAHAAKDAWGKTSAAHRSNILLKIADRIEANLDLIATAETWDNGKPIRETVNADIPLSVDHFRYFAGVLRGQEGTMSEIDNDTVAYHFHEPLGVVGQIIPWNFSILMAAWKLAPALAAGNCIVMKPAEQTPAAIMVLMELIGDLCPPAC
jgi:aldehyde dehydrogenase